MGAAAPSSLFMYMSVCLIDRSIDRSIDRMPCTHSWSQKQFPAAPPHLFRHESGLPWSGATHTVA